MLSSRKTQTNFSHGRFFAGMNAGGNLVLNTKSVYTNVDVDDEYYNSNADYGAYVLFDESPDSASASIVVVSSNGHHKKTILNSKLPPSEYYYRATLDFDGVFAMYHYPKKFNNHSRWVSVGSLPDHNICLDIDGDRGSGACGYNSVCRLVNLRPVCHCPKGFSLVDPSNPYGDCKSNFTGNYLQGGQQDDYELVEIADVDWPKNDFQIINPSSKDDCKDSCSSDYFCGAAIFRSGGCWKKRLPLPNGKYDTSLGVVTFLKVRKSSSMT
ncbi:hypothetical protein OROMI_016062 [Orobanche minor]